MNINEILPTKARKFLSELAASIDAIPAQAPSPGSVLVVNIAKREVAATDWITNLETEVLVRSGAIKSVNDAREQALACEAQASLARYIRAVDNAAESAKKPINEIRAKIIALNKSLIARVDAEGNRIGKLVSDFQIAENNRVAAARRLQDAQAHQIERERDQKLLEARTLEQQQAIKDEYVEQIAAVAAPIAPVKAEGQVVREDWTVQVVDIWLLARTMPACVKIEPRLAEIKDLLNQGVKIPGILAEKVTKSTVRLGREREAITV